MQPLLAHTVHGEGPKPILLIHGFLGSGRNLSTLARRWVQSDPGVRVVTPDLTGHGTSPPLPPGANLRTLAEDVLALADHLQLGPGVRWVGHSLGGRVALKASLLRPAEVTDVTILDISPSPIPSADPVVDTFADAPDAAPDRATIKDFLTGRGIPGGIAEWLMMNLTRDETGYRWRVDRQALRTLRETGNADDLWPAIEGGRTRITCIRGGSSGYVTDEDLARMARAGAVTHTIEGAGHFIHMDALEPLLALLLAR